MDGDLQEFGSALENEHRIDTPEQVHLHFPLAGLGSRFLALLVDLAIQFGANMVLVIVVTIAFTATARSGALNNMSNTAAKWFVAGIILVYFLLFWGYFSLFEALSNGQTPGKKVMKIRVIKDSGRQITFFEALARNLLRVVDALPGFYLVGVISILVSRSNKRLGDLVADTLGVHEQVHEFSGYVQMPSLPPQMEATLIPAGMSMDRIALLGADDLHLIDNYLARAYSLPGEARARLSSRLLDGICAKMGVPVPTEQSPERVLEGVAYQLRASVRR